MALNIKIDLDDSYTRRSLYQDSLLTTFDTTLKNGDVVPIAVKISDVSHPLLPNVYNLGFGPLGPDNRIDDKIKLYHQNYSRLFSTIILSGISFLKNNPDKLLGIDGSNNARAYLYYRCILNNNDYLRQYLNIYGVNYYIRMLRKFKEGDLPFDVEDILATPNVVSKGTQIRPEKLYNYFIFNLV
ncbi:MULTISPECIES: DUF6934 family protein [Niastella]|uniref:Uncharacterized protein n=1 Tax=Niastella soli TaxID=2821487 RepID=A0ABS3YVH0_9BACT|nr:hypothetical protein [Niastella soli]MBO9201522.1 hypothetical protein [Niastella soli]